MHRLLALVAFGLYSIYLIRVSTRKDPVKLKAENNINLESKRKEIKDSSKEGVPKVVNEKVKISIDLQSPRLDSGLPPAEVC